MQFAQVVFSLAAYVILPFTCQFLKQHSPASYSATVASSAVATFALLQPYAPLWRVLYACLHTGLVFACPVCMLSAHKFKAQINGPWDEAVPRLDVLLREPSLHAEHAP